jgi:hypothetical protein
MWTFYDMMIPLAITEPVRKIIRCAYNSIAWVLSQIYYDHDKKMLLVFFDSFT